MDDAANGALPAWAWRLVLGALAPAGRRSRLSILIFHRVLPVRDSLFATEPTAQEFERQLRWVKSWFNVLPLGDAVRRLRSGTLPQRPLCITFDDGYADNHDVALPVLRKVGLPATFFIATGYLNGGRMFNDTVAEAVRQARGPQLDLSDLGLGVHSILDVDGRRAAVNALLEKVKYLPQDKREECVEKIAELCQARLPNDLMMTEDQVSALRAAGMEIGAHTETHPILKEVTLDKARREITRGRERLQEIIGESVGLFAYPNGRPGRDYAAEHVALVRELGFDAAVSTAWGAARSGADLHQLPRFTPWDRSGWRYGARLARTISQSRFEFA